MADQLKKIFSPILDFWNKLSKKTKIWASAAAIALFLLAVTLTVLLSASSTTMLYTGLSVEESTAILGELQGLEISAQLDGDTIYVDSAVVDNARAQLATLGYPKSGFQYTYQDEVDFLSTDFDKRQAEQQQTQSRLEATIEIYEGVADATVNLAISEASSTVLNVYDEPTKASVVIQRENGAEITPEVVNGITTLVASSVPRLDPSNVSVTDERGLYLKADTGGYEDASDIMKYQLETQAEDKLRGDIERVLEPFYGPSGALVTVRVEFTVDEASTQTGTYEPNNADGTGGIITEEEGITITESIGGLGGIPGETNNAEIPTYPDGFYNGNYFSQSENSTKYAVDYVETQLNTVGYRVENISISAIVNEPEMTAESKAEMTSFLAAAIGATPSDVAVMGRSLYQAPPEPPLPFYETPAFYWLLAAGTLGFIILVYIIFVVVRSMRRSTAIKRQQKEDERQREEDSARAAAEEMQKKAEEAELARMKAELDKISLTSEIETREQKIKEEIREFAKENPEIVASIIKTMLKNDFDQN